MSTKANKRIRRHNRIRSKVKGTILRPRLSVYKSNKHLYAQIIDDDAAMTLVSISTEKLAGKGMLEKALSAGKEIAKHAQSKNIKKIVFDRGGFIYTGQVKALADGAREGGLEF